MSWVLGGIASKWNYFWTDVFGPNGGALALKGLPRGFNENAPRSQAGHNATRSSGTWGDWSVGQL